jgi:hypothetical protein
MLGLSGATITAADFRETEWVMREVGSGTRAQFEAVLEANGLHLGDLTVALELPSHEAVRAAVESGLAATVISASVAAPTTTKRNRNKEVHMIKSALYAIKSSLYATIGFAAISSIALARTAGSSDDREDLSSATAPLPPGTFTMSVHSDEWKIANALSAGPASITDHATVIDWPANPKDGMSHGSVLRQGTNGWTCMPDVINGIGNAELPTTWGRSCRVPTPDPIGQGAV